MNINFSTLLRVTIAHEYYSDGCRDFAFIATSATRKLLERGRMIAKLLDGELHLLYECDDDANAIADLAGQTLYFGLQANNTYFDNITEPVIADRSLTPLYSNLTDPLSLDAAVEVIRVAGTYAYVPSLATRPLSLRLLDVDDQPLDERSLADASASYDLRALTPGRYSIEENDGAVTLTRTLLVDADLYAADVWGVLAIKIDTSLYASTNVFTMSFSARSDSLNYYVVTHRLTDEEFDQLEVADLGFAADDRDEVAFTRIDTPFPSGCLSPTLLGEADSKVVLFRSDAVVSRRQRGLQKIRLSRGDTVLMENLPLPGPERSNADLIVRLSKP
jgi:hypothetical protein